MPAGDSGQPRPSAMAAASVRSTVASAGSVASVRSWCASPAGSGDAVSDAGAPVVAASARDISTGVPCASASASGPLDANGRG